MTSKRVLLAMCCAAATAVAQLPLLATTTAVYDEQTLALLQQTENLLRQNGTQETFTSASTTGFYEQNAADTGCLTDGAIPFVSGYGDEQNSRYFIRDGDTFVWTFDGVKTLDDVRFWTQWPDGYRTDISIASISVTYNGTDWETLAGSDFVAGKDENQNTVEPYLGANRGDLKYRMVRFANGDATPLARGIQGLKVVFGAQELGYTVHWELEAKGSEYFAGETPVVRITGCSGELAADGASATETLSLALPFVGADAAARATLSVRWGTAVDALTETTALDGTFAAGDTAAVLLTGLEPRQVYYAQAVATVGGETGVSDIVSFSARGEPITLIAMSEISSVWKPIEGTQLALATNIPGGDWVCGGGWEWAQPKIENDCIITAEEKACFALPLVSNGSYVKPERITVSARIAHSQGSGGIGFWSSVVPRSGNYPVEGGEEGATELIRYDARVNFTGIIFNPYAKTLQVYCNGSLQSPAVAVETTGDKDYHTLAYTIDTTSGEIEWVLFNGTPVHGLVTTAFTDANTAYVGIISNQGGRTACKGLEVSEGLDLPSTPVLSLSVHDMPVITGAEVSLTASAIDSRTEESLPVRLSTTDCLGATFVDGVFSWTAGEPGVYHATFSAGSGDNVDEKSVEFRVYAVPPEPPVGMKTIYATSAETASSRVYFAGSVQAGADDRTEWGLSVNRPGAAWVWNSGFDWAVPYVGQGQSEFNLSDERSSVMLPLVDSGTYSKPLEILVEASFTFTGRGVVGFWKSLPSEAASTDVDRGFTGLYFEKASGVMRLYVDGQATGSSADSVEFVDGQQTIRFVLDCRRKTISDVVLNDFPVGSFEIPSLTDEMSSYVGIGSHGNITGYNGRLQFQMFRVSGRPRGGMAIVVR